MDCVKACFLKCQQLLNRLLVQIGSNPKGSHDYLVEKDLDQIP